MRGLLLAVCLMMLSTVVRAESTLIVIGYLDFKHSFNLSGDHYVDIGFSDKLEGKIESKLLNLGYVKSKKEGKNHFTRGDKSYEIVNVNVLCIDSDLYIEREAAFFRQSSKLCASQIEASRNAMLLLNNEVKNFNRLIYFGHSRKGEGLGVGPYKPDYTFTINDSIESHFSVRNWMGGALSWVKLIACDSEWYFSQVIRGLGISISGEKDIRLSSGMQSLLATLDAIEASPISHSK